MKEMEPPNEELEKKGGRTHMRRGRHARGGKAEKVNEYNAQGSPEVGEAEDEAEDFKAGGHTKRKHGGHAEGERAKARADRAPRGKRAAGGRTHEGHGGHHHDGHEHEVEHEGAHGVHHHGAHGHAVHHHGDGDIHVHKKAGGEVREKRAAGGRAMGHSPYSSGRHLSGETGGGAAAGHEGQKVPSEPD